jgi:hypothetical protein
MARSSATAASRSSVSRNGLVLADLRQKPHSCAGRPCLAACVVLLVIGIASPALAAQVSPRVLAAAQAFWAEYNQGQSPCSSVTVTYFDGPVLATDEPLQQRRGQHRVSGIVVPRGAGQPAVRPALQLTAGRAIARLSVRGRRPRDRSRRNGASSIRATAPTSCSGTRSCRASAGRRSRSGSVLGAARSRPRDRHDARVDLRHPPGPRVDPIARGARITPLAGARGARATPAAWPVDHAVEESSSGRGCRSGVLGSAGLWRQPRQGARTFALQIVPCSLRR